MDLIGSLVDTNLKIIPSKKLINFLQTITITDDIPINIVKLTKNNKVFENKQHNVTPTKIQLTDRDIENLKKIKVLVEADTNEQETGIQKESENIIDDTEETPKDAEIKTNENKSKSSEDNELNKTEKGSGDNESTKDENKELVYLTTSDVDWLFIYLQNIRKSDHAVPYLHELLEQVNVNMPKNKTIKRNPVLEARCVKLRAQQEAREYRKMTKSVDNVRMRFPEDTIAYQLKSMNRQLIAIGQFVISIFAGFLFGFRGVEWMVGNLDFGFRLLLGVMCALVIALAEIYFLAKKLNEELNIPETVQLGGPPKFANETHHGVETVNKEHQD